MKLVSILLLSLVSSLSMAVSMHPCTPSVQGKPTQIYCQWGSNDVSIVIHFLKSPATPFCTGQNYFENRSANLTVISRKTNKILDEVAIPQELFSYTLSPKVTFTSEDPYFNLKKCVTPLAR